MLAMRLPGGARDAVATGVASLVGTMRGLTGVGEGGGAGSGVASTPLQPARNDVKATNDRIRATRAVQVPSNPFMSLIYMPEHE